MANALAIASVTALLKDLLNDGLINRNVDSLFNFRVTAQPPDLMSATSNGDPINRLNLFLYRVTPNQGWTNSRQPSRNGQGERTANQYLALDLHYMLSAIATQDLNAEILMGFGMQTLHETPVLDRDAIRAGLGAGGPLSGNILGQGFEQLAATALADQIEQIKVTPYYVSLDEVSKLWSAMNTPLRMSALYEATVVLIEPETSTRPSLPVRTRGLFVRQLQGPTINRLLSRGPGEAEPSLSRQITSADELLLQGSGLRGDVTLVAIGRFEEVPTELGDRQLAVGIPEGLHPGVNGVQVIHRIAKLPPSTELMPAEMSNVVPLILQPTLAANGIDLVMAAPEDNNAPAGPLAGTIRVTLDPAVGSRQRTEVLLNELNPPANRSQFSYTFLAEPLAEPPPDEVSTRAFPFRRVEQATYLLRVRVDGASTVLETAGGAFSGPTLVIEPAP